MKKLLLTLSLLFSFNTFACTKLSDAMDAQYGVGNWIVGTDITPAINNALPVAGKGCILVGTGSWYMYSPINNVRLAGSVIKGESSQSAVIVYSSNTGAAFNFTGANGTTGGGLQHLAIMLDTGMGNSNAIAINLEGNSQYQPDQMTFRDLYITAKPNSFWYAGFRAHGVARTHPQGIRVVTIDNMQVLAVHGLGIWIANAVQWTISNIGTYSSTGAGQNMYLAGGGTPLTNSVNVTIHAANISQDLNITNTSKFVIEAGCKNILSNSTATQGKILTFGCPNVGGFGVLVSYLYL